MTDQVASLFETLASVPANALASVIASMPAGVIHRGDLSTVVATLTYHIPDPRNWSQILSTVRIRDHVCPPNSICTNLTFYVVRDALYTLRMVQSTRLPGDIFLPWSQH